MSDMSILVVDDSVTMRRIVINSLGKLGYSKFIEAVDGKDALGKMYSEKIDFIITDWNMPEMSGLEFVTAVKKDASFKDIPILMVTTRSLKEDVMEALKIGVDNYVAKPFTPEVLGGKMQAILKKKTA
jgi:two-component system chemotaxis response regulator CheY